MPRKSFWMGDVLVKRYAWLEGDLCRIDLSRGYVATIDRCDLPVAELAWSANVSPTTGAVYAIRTENRRGGAPGAMQSLHRLIAARAGMNIAGLDVDHKNGDTLDCRRANLRPATEAQNMQNKRRGRNNTTGVVGVTHRRGRWHARIMADKQPHYLGVFSSKEEAAAVVADARRRLHGEFAREDPS